MATVKRLCLTHDPETVALLCMGPSLVDWLSDTLTQEMKPGWVDEIWAINMASNAIWHDVVFWMDDLVSQNENHAPLMELLRRRGRPVITAVRTPDILPLSYDYPIQEVALLSIEIFGKPYLNNSVAQAVAYALWKGVKTLKIYGADFTYPNRSYAEAGRGCLESWLTAATHRGMEVQVSASSSLMDTGHSGGIYGYREQPEIVLPNGGKVKFLPKTTGPYQPEDSSGVGLDNRGAAVQALHGLDGSGNPHAVNGDGEPAGHVEHADNPRRNGNGNFVQPEPVQPRGGNGRPGEGHSRDRDGRSIRFLHRDRHRSVGIESNGRHAGSPVLDQRVASPGL